MHLACKIGIGVVVLSAAVMFGLAGAHHQLASDISWMGHSVLSSMHHHTKLWIAQGVCLGSGLVGGAFGKRIYKRSLELPGGAIRSTSCYSDSERYKAILIKLGIILLISLPILGCGMAGGLGGFSSFNLSFQLFAGGVFVGLLGKNLITKDEKVKKLALVIFTSAALVALGLTLPHQILAHVLSSNITNAVVGISIVGIATWRFFFDSEEEKKVDSKEKEEVDSKEKEEVDSKEKEEVDSKEKEEVDSEERREQVEEAAGSPGHYSISDGQDSEETLVPSTAADAAAKEAIRTGGSDE
jgi:hypothetical protein